MRSCGWTKLFGIFLVFVFVGSVFPSPKASQAAIHGFLVQTSSSQQLGFSVGYGSSVWPSAAALPPSSSNQEATSAQGRQSPLATTLPLPISKALTRT